MKKINFKTMLSSISLLTIVAPVTFSLVACETAKTEEAVETSKYNNKVPITIESKKNFEKQIIDEINTQKFTFDKILVTKTVSELKTYLTEHIKDKLSQELKDKFNPNLFIINKITEKNNTTILTDEHFQIIKPTPNHDLRLFYDYANFTNQKAEIHVYPQPIDLSKINYSISVNNYQFSSLLLKINKIIKTDTNFHNSVFNPVIEEFSDYNKEIYTDKEGTKPYLWHDIKKGTTLYLKLWATNADFFLSKINWNKTDTSPRIIGETVIPINII